ncbi:MAG TPA: trigger factor [Vicinamibacteria bacterium]|nr:trigger factor [Vicinamibacteria bacterium]
MKVDYLEEGSSRRHLDIELPADDLQEAFEEGVDRLKKKVKLPGFRKGKIPRDVIRSRFRPDVLSEAVNVLVPRALNDALKEHKLYPLDDPKISKLESELGKPLRFRASFEVMPEVEAKHYEGLEVEAPKIEVTDEQVEKGLEALREEHARFDPIEVRGAQDGDIVVGDLIESPVPSGKRETHEGISFPLGSGGYHPKLHERLQGARPGDVISFEAAFPEDHQNPARASKSFLAEFRVVELKEKVLPELDDELAKDLGEFDNLDELREHLRKQARAEAERREEQELRSRLLAKLVEVNPLDAPDFLVENELDARLEAAANDLYQRGIDPNRAQIDWRNVRRNERPAAEKYVKATLLLGRIAAQENLRESDAEVDSEIEKLASALGKSASALRAQMAKEGALERLRQNLRREKAVDFIRQRAKLK